MKKILLFSFFFSFVIFNSLFSEEQCICKKPFKCCKEEICCPNSYNPSAAIKTQCGCDLYVNSSFIYWQALEDELIIGGVAKTKDLIDHINEDDQILDLDYKFKPGFKIGLGHNFNYDNWNSYIEYTRLKGNNAFPTTYFNKDNFDVLVLSEPNFLGFLSLTDTDVQTFAHMSAEWNLTFNKINWEVARLFYVGKKVGLRPFLGLSAIWIEQKFDVYLFLNDSAILK